MMKSKMVIIGLYNPKSPTNVGAVIRAAGCYQADQIRYSGRRYERAAKFHTDTHNAKKTVELMGVDDLTSGLDANTKIVCVELAVGATALPEFQHPEQAIYIFGPEDGSLPQSIVDQADDVVYVPTTGCMNLAASVNVLLYDRLSKSHREHSDKDIIGNRDNKNRLTVSR
ncbi:RNA methyltransferase [Vibrio sp. RC27]